MRDIKQKTNFDYRSICSMAGVSYGSFMRWQARSRACQPIVLIPGPKKVRPLNMAKLEDEIRNMNHGRKRSQGTGNIYRKYSADISRRDFQWLINMARYDANMEHQRNLRRIKWVAPGVVWAMDDTELKNDYTERKIHLNNLRDLASKYKFTSIVGDSLANGEKIAKHLDRQFEKYGAPLFIKRDNHGNLNNSKIHDVLNKYIVIPLNSPTYYAPYNGGIEELNGKYKKVLKNKLNGTEFPDKHIPAYTEAADNEFNHNPRRSLKGRNSCRVFFDYKDKYKFTKKERVKILSWIIEKANDIFIRMNDESKKAQDAAWRIAVETWLRMKGFIFVSINGKVLPHYSGFESHN